MLMKVGTKSILVGAHQCLWHPFTVFLAWNELYGLPDWKEAFCILVHDVGYIGCSDMDGEEGKKHPLAGMRLAHMFLDKIPRGKHELCDEAFTYHNLCVLHSRYYAALLLKKPSKLCWADKLAVKYDPWWLYLPRVILSGEIKEYRQRAAEYGEVPLSASNREWYQWAQARMIRKAYGKDARPAYEAGS
jgi:hypothetical protein